LTILSKYLSTPYPTKDVANTVYHSAIITGLAVGYSMIGKIMIKLNVADPARPDLTDFIKLSIVITLSMFTKDWLVSHKFIPEDILKT